MSLFVQYIIIKGDDICSALSMMTFISGSIVAMLLVAHMMFQNANDVEDETRILIKKLLVGVFIFHLIITPIHIFMPDTSQFNKILNSEG